MSKATEIETMDTQSQQSTTISSTTHQPHTNVLSVDVEDWYQLTAQQLAGTTRARQDLLEQQLNRLLELLAKHDCSATFFFLGVSLEHCPQLVRQIAAAGHEIASHGWGHELISRIGLDAFRQDLARSMNWLEDLLGQPIKGYRAPAFSVPPDQLERYFDILFEAGLLYDSSVFPIKGGRYGIMGSPTHPTVVRKSGSRALVELPLTTVNWCGRRWPVAGGGYWRLLPRWLIGRAIAKVVRENRPVVTYFHPYEFDRARLSATRAAGWSLRALRRGVTQNLGRVSIYAKLDAMLSRFRFSTAENYVRGMIDV